MTVTDIVARTVSLRVHAKPATLVTKISRLVSACAVVDQILRMSVCESFYDSVEMVPAYVDASLHHSNAVRPIPSIPITGRCPLKLLTHS